MNITTAYRQMAQDSYDEATASQHIIPESIIEKIQLDENAMTTKEQLSLLKELLALTKAFEEIEPHFTNRRRIGELEKQIAQFKL